MAVSGGDLDRIKGPWSPEEDEELKRLVLRHGARNWSLISKSIPGRSGKSCRLRWCNQLSPDVEHRPFSAEEDEIIIQAHGKYGNRWAAISKLLNGRTDNAIKNHWNSTLKRKLSSLGEQISYPAKRLASAGAVIASSVPTLSSSGSDVSDSSLSIPPPPHAFLQLRRTEPISQQTHHKQVQASPPKAPSDPFREFPLSLSLSLSPPGSQSLPARERMQSQAEAEAEAEAVEHKLKTAKVRLPEEDGMNFGPEFLSFLQEMIKDEVRNYMSGMEKGGLCLQSAEAIRTAVVKSIGKID